MARGRFITFEGGEGTGKSTQARMLAAALGSLGIPARTTREPGGAPGAEMLRGLLLDRAADWSPLAETLLHFAARAEHVAKTVLPALEAGHWVVCDRFTDSTIAYQGGGEGVARAVIDTLIGLIGLRPDATVILDAAETVCATRIAARGERADHYQHQPDAFHARVRASFREIAAQAPDRCVLLPAEGDADSVHRAVMRTLRERLILPA